MRHILGVDEHSLVNTSITYRDPENASASVTLMHPLDCVRSRLSNINLLRRTDDHSIVQAQASIMILNCFIESELERQLPEATRRATRALMEIENIISNHHVGRISETRFGDQLDLEAIIGRYRNDERLDVRFRDHQLGGALDRLAQRSKSGQD